MSQGQNEAAVMRIFQTLLPLVPAVGPAAAALLEAWPTLRGLAVKAGGGTGDQYDALMIDSRKNIAMLANPGQFFGPRFDVQPDPLPLPKPQSMYGSLRTDALLDDEALLELGYQIGDRVCIAAGAWMMIRKGQPTLGAQVLRTVGE